MPTRYQFLEFELRELSGFWARVIYVPVYRPARPTSVREIGCSWNRNVEKKTVCLTTVLSSSEQSIRTMMSLIMQKTVHGRFFLQSFQYILTKSYIIVCDTVIPSNFLRKTQIGRQKKPRSIKNNPDAYFCYISGKKCLKFIIMSKIHISECRKCVNSRI